MAIGVSTGSLTTQASSFDAQTDRVLNSAKLATTGKTALENAKIDKAGKDFESILLGNWLQQAEQSFAKVPGGDGDDDDDSSKDQFQGIAMQALAGSLTASGGIGIAKMITSRLHTAAEHEQSDKSTMKTKELGAGQVVSKKN